MLRLKNTVAAVVLGLGCTAFAQANDYYLGELSFDTQTLFSNYYGAGGDTFFDGASGYTYFHDVITFHVADDLLSFNNPLSSTFSFNTAYMREASIYLYKGDDLSAGPLLTYSGYGFFDRMIDLDSSLYTVVVTGISVWDHDCVYSIEFGVSGVVPEPETYAMLLAGLGIVGAVARRRKVNVN